jgi:hypothetical protein
MVQRNRTLNRPIALKTPSTLMAVRVVERHYPRSAHLVPGG